MVAGLVLAPKLTAIVFVAACIVAYAGAVTQRIILTNRSLTTSTVVVVTDEEARRLPDDELPVYTVLVPIYNEAAVVEELVAHLRAHRVSAAICSRCCCWWRRTTPRRSRSCSNTRATTSR